jgi:coatomer subunit beta'
VIILLFLLKY